MPSHHMNLLIESMSRHFGLVNIAINSNAARQSESLTKALASISRELVDQIKALTVNDTSWVIAEVADRCRVEHDEANQLYPGANTMAKLAVATYESRDALGRTAALASSAAAPS